MPKVTPHVCRHTFCSNMAKSGMNPKTLQKIMGHSDIGVTLNTYTHVGFDDPVKSRKNQHIRRNANMIKILFICHGNICRSTMAEYVMKYITDQAGLTDSFYIDSAATSREEIGNPVHHGTRRKLKEKGIPCGDHRARQMRREEYDKFDYIIGMDSWNIRNINRIIGNNDPDNKVFKLLDFTERKGQDIADPWYTGNFDDTYRDVKEGCEALMKDCLLRL